METAKRTEPEFKTVSARDVVNYFLTKANPDEERISNLKMQKLLYYAQGFHLAMTGKPLFNESIEAWRYGPVVPAVYHELKQHRDGPLPPAPEEFDPGAVFSAAQLEILDEVFEVYGQFSAWKLRDLTHDETPWQRAQSNAGTISHDSLREYFVTQLNK